MLRYGGPKKDTQLPCESNPLRAATSKCCQASAPRRFALGPNTAVDWKRLWISVSRMSLIFGNGRGSSSRVIFVLPPPSLDVRWNIYA